MLITGAEHRYFCRLETKLTNNKLSNKLLSLSRKLTSEDDFKSKEKSWYNFNPN